MFLPGCFLFGLESVKPTFLDALLAPGPVWKGRFPAIAAEAHLLRLTVAFLLLEPVVLSSLGKLIPGLLVFAPALGSFLRAD